MELPTVTERIASCLNSTKNEHNADLVARWSPSMETQVNIDKTKGTLIEGTKSTYRHTHPEGFTIDYWPIRMPKNADSVPTWYNRPLDWPLEWFAVGIGSTGWDWMDRVSRWVGFDFDSIVGHGEGLTPERLEEIKAKVQSLDYAELRKSTGGEGIHVYVHVEIPTANHTIHSQLAKAILVKMSRDCGFDFAGDVDCFGGNMWIWHRKMKDTEGLKLLKAATRTIKENELPDWREQSTDDFFDQITRATYGIVELDDRHKATIAEAKRLGWSSDWIDDKRCWNTHTAGLKVMAEQIGVEFSTASPGSNKTQANCFCFPTPKGWIVYRFGGASDDSTWTTENGKTFREFNFPTTSPRNKQIEVFKFPELRKAFPKLNPPVIDGLLRQGETCNIVSSSKIGKSWFGYGLLLSVASGHDWLGRFGVSPGEVGLIDNELHKETLSDRITTVANAMNLADDVLRNLSIWPLRGNLRSLDEMERELSKIEPGRFKLLVFDALYRFAREGVSENDNSEMARVYNTLDRIAERTRAGIVVVHHSTKGNQSNKKVTDVGAGAGAQSRAADCHLVLREHETDGTMVLDAVVRSFKPIDPVTIEWEHPLWRPSDADPTRLKVDATQADKQQEARDIQGMNTIVELLQRGPATTAQLRKQTGMGQPRVEKLLCQMERGNLVTSSVVKVNGRECAEYALPA